MNKISNLQTFIEFARTIHGDKLDYSESVYINRKVPMVITCKKCKRRFEQSPSNHTNSAFIDKYKLRDGCEYCDSKSRNSKPYFIKKAQEIHGNDYDYSLIKEYEEAGAKIEIIHKKCGLRFFQTKNAHNRGDGCPCNCPKIRTKEEFIEDAKKIHGDAYDYSNIKYIDTSVNLELKCNECDEVFLECPRNHLHCPKKNKTQVSRCPNCKDYTKVLTKEEFVEKAVAMHADKYDYSEVEYINTKSFVKIKCNNCSKIFEQIPNAHLAKRENNLGGCPECCFVNSTESRGEKLIVEYLTKNNIEFIRQYTNKTCKFVGLLKFDFFIESLNLFIEYDGAQHFIPVKHWGGQENLDKTKQRDEIKNNWARENGFRLIRFKYDCFSIEILDNAIKELFLFSKK